jgi:hypothetical protein
MHGDLGLSYNARKALCVQLGDTAGTEVANLVQRLAAQIEELKRVKVNVTPVVPGVAAENGNNSRLLDMEAF